MSCENCDFLERLKQLQETKPEERLYGKKILSSHEKYSLYNSKNDTFDTTNIMRLYSMFTYNVLTLLKAGVFKYKWVNVDELLTATKGKIWDWSSDEEKAETCESIKQFGLHFPIFTLSKGILHNQVDPLEPESYKNKYNSYNGNHRIDAIQSMDIYKDTKVLIIIIPEFCEKSCTGFRYTPIDYHDIENIPFIVTERPILGGVNLFHLRELEDEMKMHNLPTVKKDTWPGIDVVTCIDYQCAFRILQEFQNALEVPLTMYCKKAMNGPDFYHDTFIDTNVFNIEFVFDKFLKGDDAIRSYIKVAKCPYASAVGTCFLLEQGPRRCDKMLCCKHCPKIKECDSVCVYFKP